MIPFSITYRGQLRCEAEHLSSGTRLLTDAPKDNHGRGESFSPTDLVATALGTCMMTVMGIAAQRDGVALEGTTIAVEKHMTATPPRRIAKLVVRFTMNTGVPPARRAALEHAARTCPVLLSIHPDIVVEHTFTWPD